MAANLGSELRTCSLMDWRALWILPSCTAFCTACEGGTASTSARMVCEENAGWDLAGGGVATLVEICGCGIVGRGGGAAFGGGPAGPRGGSGAEMRTGFLLSTAFLYL